MKTPWWLLLLLVGCAGAGRPPKTAKAPVTHPVERAAVVREDWTRIAPRHRPTRLENVAALADGSFVVLAGSEVSRVTAGGAVTPVCAMDPDLVVSELHAAGTCWWVLAGEVFAPVVYRGDDRSMGCVREALPALVARDAPPGQLRSTRVGNDDLVWSSAGAMARSREGTHTWQRIPSLPEVVAVTVSGATLYAAALLGGPDSRTPFDRHGYEVFALHEGETRWTLAAVPGDRAEPVALLPREGGGVVGIDVLGGFELTAQGTGRIGRSAGPHFAQDRPRLLLPAAPDAAVGLTAGMLFEYRLAGWRPLPVLPDERLATSLDAAPDGSLVVSDGHELWRIRAGVAPSALLRSPLEGGRPTRLAAAGPVIAALSGRDRLSMSRDEGATWMTTAVPTEAGSARSLGVLPDGVVAVITGGPSDTATGNGPRGAIWLVAGSLHRVELPRGARVLEGGVSLHAIGERWLLTAGDVFVSDDQGAHWRITLSSPTGNGDGWGVVALSTAAGRTAYALDSDGGLWRSDDAGDQFVALTRGHAEGGRQDRHPSLYGQQQRTSDWLHWDGGDALLASIGQQLFRFEGEGHGTVLGSSRGVVFGAAVEGGAVIATNASTTRVSECGRDGEPLLMAVSTTGALAAVPGVCSHLAVAFALDGDWLYTADADGTIERASLRGLWREALATDHP